MSIRFFFHAGTGGATDELVVDSGLTTLLVRMGGGIRGSVPRLICSASSSGSSSHSPLVSELPFCCGEILELLLELVKTRAAGAIAESSISPLPASSRHCSGFRLWPGSRETTRIGRNGCFRGDAATRARRLGEAWVLTGTWTRLTLDAGWITFWILIGAVDCRRESSPSLAGWSSEG